MSNRIKTYCAGVLDYDGFSDLNIDLVLLCAVWSVLLKITFSVSILKSFDLNLTLFSSKISSLFKKLPSFAVIKIFLLSGFLAAFTTFSTFAWESVSLIQQEMYIKLVIYCLASITLSILFCLYGYNLGK